MRHTPVLLAAAIAAVLATPALAAPYAPVRWAQMDGLSARSIAIGDLNWDKLDDLVVFSDDPASIDKILIYLQQPNGTLMPNSSTLWSNAFSPSIALVDLEYNSEPEIVVGSAAGFSTIHYNYGYGNFFTRTIATPFGCEHVAAADLDGDHYADVVCQSMSSGATVWHNAQNGTFSESANVATDRVPGAMISLADLTGDGKMDLLLSTPGGSGFAVHPHSGTWSFGAATRYAAPSTAPISTSAIGDLNHDGRPEALIVSNATAPDAAVWSYATSSGGALAAPLKFVTHDAPVGVLARDLDRDGRDDLVVASAGGGVGVQLQGAAYVGLGGSALFAGDSSSLAAGDLDNDGCTDIAYTTTTGGLAIAYGGNCKRVRARSDFDGDGRSDLLWSNVATGAGTIWKAADSTHAVAVTRVANPAWFIAGTGDFNGDGRADLLWRNDATGAQVLWYSGNAATQKSLTSITDLGWKIVGIGDFDGDGRADVLWRHATTGHNAIWRSGDSATRIAVAAVTNTQWVAAGVGDFDGDGRDDILWRNPASWANVVWRSANANLTIAVAANSDPTARVWVGDFNGDRHADLLWCYTNGEYNIWLRPDDTLGQQNMPVGADWRVVSTGDFDGNGTVDLVWRNMRTGQDSIWRSASSFVPRAVSPVTNFSWVVVR